MSRPRDVTDKNVQLSQDAHSSPFSLNQENKPLPEAAPLLSASFEKYYQMYYSLATEDRPYRQLEANNITNIEEANAQYRKNNEAFSKALSQINFASTSTTQQKNKDELTSEIALALYYTSSVKEAKVQEILSDDQFYELLDAMVAQHDNKNPRSSNRDSLVNIIFQPLDEVHQGIVNYPDVIKPLKDRLKLCLSNDSTDPELLKYNRTKARALVSFLDSLYTLKTLPTTLTFAIANKRATQAPGGIAWKRYLVSMAAFVAMTAVTAVIFYYTAPVLLTAAAVFALFGKGTAVAAPLTGLLYRCFFKPKHCGDSNNAKAVALDTKYKPSINNGHNKGGNTKREIVISKAIHLGGMATNR